MRSNLAKELSKFIEAPANDNGLGFHYVDIETDEAANDNSDFEEIDEDICADPRWYDFVEAEPDRLERLLNEAGYDDALIPADLRRTAFEVALCFQKGLFDREQIAEALGFTRGQVRRASEALRRAARPGTNVG